MQIYMFFFPSQIMLIFLILCQHVCVCVCDVVARFVFLFSVVTKPKKKTKPKNCIVGINGSCSLYCIIFCCFACLHVRLLVLTLLYVHLFPPFKWEWVKKSNHKSKGVTTEKKLEKTWWQVSLSYIFLWLLPFDLPSFYSASLTYSTFFFHLKVSIFTTVVEK